MKKELLQKQMFPPRSHNSSFLFFNLLSGIHCSFSIQYSIHESPYVLLPSEGGS